MDVGRIDYLDGFQYKDGRLQFFPTSEGYVRVTHLGGVYVYSYVYNYTDHLGNVRLSYAKDPQNPNVLRILEENHYYPFGLKHTNYNSGVLVHREDSGTLKIKDPDFPKPLVPILPYSYKYNGKEWQDELGLGMYDYGARNYDPAIGRWMNIDPLAEQGRRWSPYNYAMDNPVFFIDPDGMLSKSFLSEIWNKSGGGMTLWNHEGGKFSDNSGESISDEDGELDNFTVNISEDTGNQNGNTNGGEKKDNGGNKGTGGNKPSLEDLKKGPPNHPDYKSPRGGDRKVKNPNGQGSGWIDSKGRVWVPTDHKGTHAPHWDRENPDGTHTNVYPSTKPIKSPSSVVTPTNVATGIGVGYIAYKVVVAILTWECFGCGVLVTP